MQPDDDAPRPSPPGARALDRLGIAELLAFVAELRAEIVRAEQEIARKQGMRNAAEDVFRRP